MPSNLDIMASAIANKAHSFQFIREATGLKMSDEEFRALAQSEKSRFKLVRFVKRSDEGVRIHPGRPGVALRK